MAEHLIRRLRSGDIEELAQHMRQADLDEIAASSGKPALDILADSVRGSSVVLALELADGSLGCIFGVAPMGGLLGTTGAPWLLGTRALERNPRALIELGPRYLALMLASYPRLFNYVDARNKRSIRWLKWLGFTFHDAKPYGAAGLPFHYFEMRAHHV